MLRLNERAGLDTERVVEIVATASAESFPEQPQLALTAQTLSDCKSGNVYDLHVAGSTLFLEGSDWDEASSSWGSMFSAIDLAEPSSPRVIARSAFGQADWHTYAEGGPGPFFGPHPPQAWGPGFAARLEWLGEDGNFQTRARIIDLREGQELRTRTVELPPAPELYAGLVRDGAVLVTSRLDSGATSSQSKVYAQRIDVSDPSKPELLPAILVPGVVLSYDHEHTRALTLATQRERVAGIGEDECRSRFASYEITSEGECIGYTQTLNLVRFDGSVAELEDSVDLNEAEWITATSASSGTVFVAVGRGGYYTRAGAFEASACELPCAPEPVEVLGLRGFDSGTLEVGRLDSQAIAAEGGAGGWGPARLHAAGSRVLLVRDSYVVVIDVSDVLKPRVTKVESLRGYVRAVDIRGERALLTLDDVGVQWIELGAP